MLRLHTPAPLSADIAFSPGWKLLATRAHFAAGPLVAYHVPFDGIEGRLRFDGRNLVADQLIAHQGDHHATGSYTMDASTLAFRFLLQGRLRPPGISGFFSAWWSRFWSTFRFPEDAPAPLADVDVAGRWLHPHTTTVFVHADVTRPTLRTVPFDRVRTTMFIRPEHYDATEMIATRGPATATGTFLYSMDHHRPDSAMRSLDFNLTTDHDLNEIARLLGPAGAEIVAPFTFAQPPLLRLTGRLDGPASPRGSHRTVEMDLRSTGPFTLHGFPLSDLRFHGTLRDDDIELDTIEATFAQGRATGRARLTGREPTRRLSFDLALTDALLGEAIRATEDYSAKTKNLPPSPTSRFQQRIAEGRLRLQLSATGNYADLLSYHGHGHLTLSGAQLAQINLLGSLSEVLDFTSLQLNAATTQFILQGDTLTLPDLKITGPSALIETDGTCQLGPKTIAFNAKLYPFGRGKTLLSNTVDLVLSPLSNALELKLEGSLEHPKWRFAYGPTSVLRSLSGPQPPAEKDAPPPPPAPPVPRR